MGGNCLVNLLNLTGKWDTEFRCCGETSRRHANWGQTKTDNSSCHGRDKREEALRLAQISAEKPHFSHCLEWLLFTVFDAEISRQNLRKNHAAVSNHSTDPSLLEKTCDLIKSFPEYYDVVVSVARKTDGRHCVDLFLAVGRSTELFEECFQRRWYRTAAYYILSNLKNMSCGYIPENTKCKLLHWCGDGVFAEGRIASTYPNIKVHHVSLGGSCWKFWVDRVLVEHVDLIRPNSEMTFLEEAI